MRIGMDTSKSFFQVHGVDADERPVLRRKLSRKQMISFFEKLAPTVVGIEACGAAHHWGRVLSQFGHEVKLLPPQLVKPYVKRNKNDARDAEGLCEAMSRPTMRFVRVKTAEEQAALMLAGMRERLTRNRTQLANSIRGYAAEFGLIAPKGLAKIEDLLLRTQTEESLPAMARELFAKLAKDYAELEIRFAELDAQLMAWHRANEMSRRLAQIPGIGPIGASLTVMKVQDPKAFRSGRDYAAWLGAAWLGLTPKDHSTAGKQRLGVITKAGDEDLRSLLVTGAMSMIRQVKHGKGKLSPSRPSPWLVALVERKAPKLAAVALANKNARICWKLMVSGERYNPRGRPAVTSAKAA
jgi:transposase